MTSRVSYNIHAITNNLDKPHLLSHLIEIQPAWVLVMDGLQLAKQIKTVLPGTNVISRIYPDEEIYKFTSPQQWVDQKVAEIGGADIWNYTINEAGFGDTLLNWFTALIEYAASKHLKVVIGNFSVGTPEATDWSKPAAVAMLQMLDKHRDTVVLGLHEYACGVITSGLLGGWPDNAGVQPGTPGGRNLVQTWPKPEEVDSMTRFHMGRFKFLLDFCKKVGIRPPRLVITEWGFDDLADIAGWSQQQPKTPPYTSLRGWKSLVNAWHVWYPHLTAEQSLYEQLAWADNAIYARAGIEGMTLFCWGHSSDSWLQFDLSGALEFQQLLENRIPPTVPPPVITPPPPVVIPPVTGITLSEERLNVLINRLTIARDQITLVLSELNSLKG